MTGSYIVLDIELSAIKNFLDHVIQESGMEIDEVVQQYEEGGFSELDDYGNALFNPISRQEIAIRAVLYEITALVEHELQMSAHPAWLLSEKPKGPKTLVELSNWGEIGSLRMVSDERFPRIRELIEQHYQIRIDELPGAEVILGIRETVNAFKHTRGLKDFRKLNPTPAKLSIINFYRPKLEAAYNAIEQARMFIRALWKATGRAR